MNIFKKNYNNYYEYIDNLLKIFENSVKYFYTSKNSLVITDETFKEILSKIIDIYKKILNSPKKELHYKETKIKDDVNSNFYILFNQDQYIETVKILKTIFDIYQYLCDNNDKDLKEKIHYTIYDLLLFSSSKEDNQAEVNYILDRLFLCMLSDKNSLTMYYNFYTIVFDRFRKEKFNNIYLDSFNKYAFNVVKYLLDINDLETFKNIIDYSIGHSLDIYDPEGKNEDSVKIRKFRDLFLKISSLALYKKNYDALDLLFNFHTPKDSRVMLCNEDILPHSIKDVFEWIFNNNIWLENVEDNHSIDPYYKIIKYLLILRALYHDGNIISEIQLSYLSSISLQDLHDLQQLNSDAQRKYHPNIKYDYKDLKQPEEKMKSIIESIFNNLDLLKIIGIKENCNKIKDEFIKDLLKISELANKKEENIIKTAECSEDKIIKFKREILSNYTENEGLLSVFQKYNLVSTNNYKNFKESEFWAYNDRLPKEMFLNDYPVSYVGFASSYGEGMRRTENYRILEKIREKTKIDYIENLEDLIYNNKNKDDLFIILNYADLFNLRSLQKTMDIILKDKYLFSEEEKSKFNKYYNLKNFSGIMIFKDISIPVYSYFMGDDKSQLFLLSKNKEKFGSVVEYIYNGEGNEYFDEQTKLFCKLSEMDDKKSVWLQLYKKIDVNLSDSFEGYMISLKDTVY